MYFSIKMNSKYISIFKKRKKEVYGKEIKQVLLIYSDSFEGFSLNFQIIKDAERKVEINLIGTPCVHHLSLKNINIMLYLF